MKKNFIIISIVCLICVIFILSIHIIPTGYTGIKSTFGLIHPDPLKSGRIYFTIPFCESIEKINNKMQDFDIKTKIWGETNDKTPVYAEDLHITYQIMPERSVWIYTNINDYKNNLLNESLISSAIKKAMIKLTPEEVTNRAIIEEITLKTLQNSVDEKYGKDTIYISKIVIGNMDFEDAYNEAIQSRSLATQEKLRIQIENETMISQAEAQKTITLLNTQTQTEKIKMEAEAQAEANMILQESISKELMILKLIELWDGKLPLVIGNTDNIIDISGIIE